MALATKCPHCNTTFRVAHDQLKLRGGIVRCGACNEVFDGNAALVDPVPRTPVIIDLPDVTDDTPPAAVAAAAPADAAPFEAAADTGTAHGVGHDDADAMPEPAPEAAVSESGTGPAPELAPEPEAEPEPEADRTSELHATAVPGAEPEPAAGLSEDAALPREPDFDLDLNGDEAPVPVLAAETTAALPALSTAQEDAFDLDLDIDVDAAAPGQPILPADDFPQPVASDTMAAETLDDMPAEAAADIHHFDIHHFDEHHFDEHRFDDSGTGNRLGDGRREPTLDIPDGHVAAIALHDSFELDAYPRTDDDGLHSTDARGHTLDGGVWRNRDSGQDGRDDGLAGVHHLGEAPEPATAAPDAPFAAMPARSTTGNDASTGDDDGDGDGDDIVTLSPAATGGGGLAPEPSGPATPVSAREPDEPGFVKRSRRRERWGKASRIIMACALPLLLAGLAYQAVATFRNPLAAAIPALKPALVSACAMVGCKVELPTQLDALSIEQGELQTLADNIFSFSTSLRNQSATAQSWPHIELILNDSADKPVLRRVFAPRDYLPPGADLASGFLPRSEQSVKLHFELSRVKASGYHIAVFYP